MLITKTRTFGGKVYFLSPTGHKNKRSANSSANSLRRAGYLARVVGNKEIGWFVYYRSK